MSEACSDGESNPSSTEYVSAGSLPARATPTSLRAARNCCSACVSSGRVAIFSGVKRSTSAADGCGVRSATDSGSGARTRPARASPRARLLPAKRACSTSSRRCAVCSRARITSTSGELSAALLQAVTRSNSSAAASVSSALRRFAVGEAETEVRLAHAAHERTPRDLGARVRRCQQRAASGNGRTHPEVERALDAEQLLVLARRVLRDERRLGRAGTDGLLYVAVKESRTRGRSAARACVTSSAAVCSSITAC